jgi:hypothetical protein
VVLAQPASKAVAVTASRPWRNIGRREVMEASFHNRFLVRGHSPSLRRMVCENRATQARGCNLKPV